MNNQVNNKSSDPLWIDTPTVLYDKNRWVEFFPASWMSINEMANSIARFVVIAGCIGTVYEKKVWPFVLGLSIAIFSATVAMTIDKTGKSNNKTTEADSSGIDANIVSTETATTTTTSAPIAVLDSPQETPANVSSNYYGTGSASASHVSVDASQSERKFISSLYKNTEIGAMSNRAFEIPATDPIDDQDKFIQFAILGGQTHASDANDPGRDYIDGAYDGIWESYDGPGSVHNCTNVNK
jgi:hypothetical protein